MRRKNGRDGRPSVLDKAQFLNAVVDIVRVWQTDPKAGDANTRIRGCAFSILALLDGGHVGCPGSEVRLLGERCPGRDLAGGLHEAFANLM